MLIISFKGKEGCQIFEDLELIYGNDHFTALETLGILTYFDYLSLTITRGRVGEKKPLPLPY